MRICSRIGALPVSKKCQSNKITKSIIELVPKDEQIKHQNINNLDTNNGTCIAGNVSITNVYNFPDNTLYEEMKLVLDRNRGNISTDPRMMIRLPADLLGAARDPVKFPGAITSRGDKVIEKLPDGGERKMSRNKAVKTFANEAITAIINVNPTDDHYNYFTKEHKDDGSKKTASLQETIEAHANNSTKYHHKIPDVTKNTSRIIENKVEQKMNDILKANV